MARPTCTRQENFIEKPIPMVDAIYIKAVKIENVEPCIKGTRRPARHPSSLFRGVCWRFISDTPLLTTLRVGTSTERPLGFSVLVLTRSGMRTAGNCSPYWGCGGGI